MTEDLKTRLRTWDDQQPPFKIMSEAADYIERLETLIVNYCRAEDDYKYAWDNEIAPVTPKDEWVSSTDALFAEAYRIMVEEG